MDGHLDSTTVAIIYYAIFFGMCAVTFHIVYKHIYAPDPYDIEEEIIYRSDEIDLERQQQQEMEHACCCNQSVFIENKEE